MRGERAREETGKVDDANPVEGQAHHPPEPPPNDKPFVHRNPAEKVNKTRPAFDSPGTLHDECGDR